MSLSMPLQTGHRRPGKTEIIPTSAAWQDGVSLTKKSTSIGSSGGVDVLDCLQVGGWKVNLLTWPHSWYKTRKALHDLR